MPGLDELKLPANLSLSLPAQLLKQRPDVAAAAAAMEGAAADAKAALVAQLPAITLSAAAGGAARDFSSLFTTGNPFWTLIGGLTAPLFHSAALKASQKAAEAALETAKANYRGIVLQSLADVSNALTALSTGAQLLDASTRADQSAQTNLGYARRQLELGAVGSLALGNRSDSPEPAYCGQGGTAFRYRWPVRRAGRWAIVRRLGTSTSWRKQTPRRAASAGINSARMDGKRQRTGSPPFVCQLAAKLRHDLANSDMVNGRPLLPYDL